MSCKKQEICLWVEFLTLHADKLTDQIGINYHRDTLHDDKLWVWVDTDWEGDKYIEGIGGRVPSQPCVTVEGTERIC